MNRVLCLAILVACVSNSLSARSPNIVFIFIDDMGYADPSCFGNPHVKTPRIDQLAAEGIKLTNFYVNSPICSPSRVAVTTGNYPSRWKIHSYLNSRAGNKSRGMRDYLDGSAPTTARKLKAAGYATAHFGKWHMGGGRDVDDAPLPTEYGFDESLVAFEGLGDRLITNPKNSTTKLGHGKISFCDRWQKTEKYTNRTIDFIRRNRDKPFYVRLFPNDVHDPHVNWPGTDEKWKSVTTNHWEQKFFAVLQEMDKQIGRVIDEVEQLGLSDNTLFLFTSDNGPTDWPKYYQNPPGAPPGFTGPFFGRKWSLYEGGIRMPFIARWKGKIPAGVTDDESVMSGIDLSPTFCGLAGVDVPASDKLDGIDCSSVLLGKPQPRPEPLFWQYGAPHAVLKPGKLEFQSPSFAIRDGNWKLLVNPNGSEAQLFDLTADPSEQKNLIATESKRAHSLQAKIGKWANKVGLSFDASASLKQPVPAVAAMVNNQLLRFENRGVEGDGKPWKFNGSSWLDLPRGRAPNVQKKWVRAGATIQSSASNGVIVAHGGDRNGYSMYLRDGKLAFSVCADWKRTTAMSEFSIGQGAHKVEFFLAADGNFHLMLDGKKVANGKAASSITANPGDSVQIGADTIKPVGEYKSENPFHGTISDFYLKHER